MCASLAAHLYQNFVSSLITILVFHYFLLVNLVIPLQSRYTLAILSRRQDSIKEGSNTAAEIYDLLPTYWLGKRQGNVQLRRSRPLLRTSSFKHSLVSLASVRLAEPVCSRSVNTSPGQRLPLARQSRSGGVSFNPLLPSIPRTAQYCY